MSTMSAAIPGWRLLVVLAIVTLAQVPVLGAQQAARDSTWGATSEAQGIELWAAGAKHSPRLGFLGDTPNINMGLLAVRWTRTIRSEGKVHVEYTADLVPVAVLSPPLPTMPGTTSPSAICIRRDCVLTVLPTLFPAGSAFGAGLSPVGLTWLFYPNAWVRPVLTATGGLLWFDRNVPTTGARRVNAVATIEGGLRIGMTDRTDLTVAYRFHHLSNAGTAENTALASQLLSIGVRRRLAHQADRASKAER